MARRIASPGGLFPGLIPQALDEGAIAAALLWAAWRREGAALLAAWAAYCGLMAGLLAANAAPLLGGPEKPGAMVYTLALSALLALGLWATRRAWRLRGQPAAPDRG